MSDQLPACPECASEYTYENGTLLTCPMCAHEWVPSDDVEPAIEEAEPVIKDSVGNELADGDTVIVVKDLKVKGGGALKIGTKVRGIRLVPGGPDGHDIDARVPGHGQMMLKSSVVRKS